MKNRMIVPVLLFMVFCTACAGKQIWEEEKKEPASSYGSAAASEEEYAQDAIGSEEDSSGTHELAQEEWEDEQMKRDEVVSRITGKLGEGCESFAEETETAMDGGLLFIKLGIAPGKEAEAEAWLNALCGKGHSAADRKLPAFQNKICEELRGMKPLYAYTHFRQGENGIKTAETEMFTAEEEGRMYIFILGL